MRTVLASRQFRLLALGRTFVVIGNGIAPVALAFAVLDLTGSATELGLVVACRSVANVAILVVGGVLADRLPRNLILVGTAVCAGLTELAIGITLTTGVANVAILCILSTVNGLAAGLDLPASSAVVPLIVKHQDIRSGNAILRIAINSGTILGASGGALLIGLTSPAAGIFLDAGTFLLAAVFFAAMRLPRRETPPDDVGVEERPPSLFHDFIRGWNEFASRRWVWVVVLQFAVVNAAFTGGVSILGPAIADDSFGRALWGLVLSAETAGFLAGGALALRWRPKHSLGIGVGLVAGAALPVLVLALHPGVLITAICFFVGGVTIEQFTVAWDQSLQQRIPADRLARVYSFDALGSLVAVPIGQTIVGPLSGAIGSDATLVIAAAAILIATAAAIAQRDVRAVTAVST